MIKDESQPQLANAFRLASVVGVFDVQVQIKIRGRRLEIKGISRFITDFKTHMYKTSKLMPRVSDPDFKERGFSDDEPGKPLLPIDKNADGIRPVWLDTQPKLKDIIDFLMVRCSDTL